MRALKLASCMLCALLALSTVHADAVDAPVSCDSHVAEAVAPLKADLQALASKKDLAVQEAQTCKAATKELKAQLQANAAELAELQASVATLEEQLATARVKSAKADLDLPTVLTALAELAKQGALASWAEANAVFQELKVGKTDKLTTLVSGGVHHVKTASSAAYAFVATEADEHLPPAVKAKAAELAAHVQAAWKQHVTGADWAQPVLAKLQEVNAEVTRVVTRAVQSHPALKPLADPVSIQLAVYAVFTLPVLLLLVLPCLLLPGKRRAPGSTPGTQRKQKKARGPRA